LWQFSGFSGLGHAVRIDDTHSFSVVKDARPSDKFTCLLKYKARAWDSCLSEVLSSDPEHGIFRTYAAQGSQTDLILTVLIKMDLSYNSPPPFFLLMQSHLSGI